MRIVKDAHDWQQMDGDSPLEQMVNAYLTTQFIFSKDMPSDECLHAAKKLVAMFWAYGESADPGAAWDVLGRDKFKCAKPPTTGDGDE